MSTFLSLASVVSLGGCEELFLPPLDFIPVKNGNSGASSVVRCCESHLPKNATVQKPYSVPVSMNNY